MSDMLGVMLDMSRNAVMKPERIKDFAKIIKAMGYNTLLLYMEDTYELDNEPFFGHLRGRYTKAELKDIDAFCQGIEIEVIPCIQTLAHLNCLFKWQDAYGEINDCNDILLCEHEKTYELIEKMISTLSECFTTKRIHIGMDEADNVGIGKYKQIHGVCDRFDIINRHLHKVCAIADKYGIKPMFWSDMFVRLATGSDDQYADTDISKICERANLPENVDLVYWDYYSTDYDHYIKMLNTNKAFGKEVVFAGGAWTWRGFAPDNDFSFRTTEPAVKACRDCDIKNMFFTVWGDDGGECPKFTILPALMYTIEIIRGNYDMDSIKKKFSDITGCDFDTMLLLDKVDRPDHGHNPSKYLLYNDVFMGVNDNRCKEDDADYYKALAKELKDADAGSYKYMFDSFSALADVLAVKCDLGVRTRKAYKADDITALKNLVAEYTEVCERIKTFHKLFRDMWYYDNKPHGFDIQDTRLGGLMQRILSCKERLEDYTDGKITEIPELAEEITGVGNGTTWARIISVNQVSHWL